MKSKKVITDLDGPFEPTWESLSNYRVPSWYIDGKFGIFIHWGVYCVPAFGNEWYPRNLYQQGTPEFEHHRKQYGPQKQFGYKDFIPQLTASSFDPNEWASLFRAAGARFVVPVAEHHDGFAMYDCGYSDWCAAKMGPKRDIIGELAEAVRRQFLVFGVSSHRAEHWWFFDGGMGFDSDVRDPRFYGLYGPAQPRDTQPNEEFLEDWLARTCELVDSYQPQLVWFDWWIKEPVFEPYLRRFAAYYYNRAHEWNRAVAINFKIDAFPKEAAVFDIERGQLAEPPAHFWQNDTSVSRNSWGYIEGQDYKDPAGLIGDLVDVVSKNGALLLNIGPRPDGTIPEPEQETLRTMGQWLSVNGEAIYDSRPWKVHGEGPTRVPEGSFTDTKRATFGTGDLRFTTRGQTLYATFFDWPASGEIRIRSLGSHLPLYAGEIASVSMLGDRASLAFSREADTLRVPLPKQKPCEHAWVLKISPAP